MPVVVHDIKIRLKHECPFLDLTEKFDGISYGYCIRSYDVLSLPGKLSEEMNEQAKQGFPNFDTWKITSIKNRVTYIQMSCLCESLYEVSITGQIQNAGGLIRYPISYENGWEQYSITAFDARVSANVLSTLDQISSETEMKIEIISNRDVGIDGLFKSQLISGPELFADLTTTQLNTLIKAVEMGYYQIPRETRTLDIAEMEGKNRYTVDKLIRTAENKIISNLTPYLYFKQYLDQGQ